MLYSSELWNNISDHNNLFLLGNKTHMLNIVNKLTHNRTGKQFILTVIYQKDFDIAIVLELLKQLGLNRPGLLDLFNQNYFRGNFVSSCVSQIRNQQGLLAEHLKQAKTLGQVTVPIMIDYFLLKQIADFLKDVTEQIGKRLAESATRYTLSDFYTAYGIVKDINETQEDIAQGLRNAIGGFWTGNTSAIGTQKFKDGWNRFFSGIEKTGIGYLKLGFQLPLNAFAAKLTSMTGTVQTLLGIESLGRLLTPNEISLLKSIFANSLTYEAIRIKSGYAGLFNAGDNNGLTLTNNTRPITICNTIYMKETSLAEWDRVLVHETTHIWQFQNGGTDYMCEALFAQMSEGYEFADAITKQNRTWKMLNPEQQAYLIEQAYLSGYFTTNLGNWLQPVQGSTTKIPRPDLVKYMSLAITQLHAGKGAT